MTPEAKVKARVKDLLRRYEAYWHMPVQNGMGAPTLDFHVLHGPFGCAIETKAPGKKMTTRQELTAKEIRSRGGIVFVTDGDLKEIEQWLQLNRARSKLMALAECTPDTAESFLRTTDESLR